MLKATILPDENDDLVNIKCESGALAWVHKSDVSATEGCDPEPPPVTTEDKSPMLHVVMKDGTAQFFSCPDGLRFDASRRLLVVRDPRINRGPTFIPVENLSYWTTVMD